MAGGPPRVVWHTTETHPSKFFTAETYYHAQLREWQGQVLAEQHIDLNLASKALRRPTSHHTNRRGEYCVNIAIVGYAANTPHLSKAMVDQIAEWSIWFAAALGVPPVFPRVFLGGEAYGASSPTRMGDRDWERFAGHCGHQHVPRNTHWDPGRFPVARITSTIGDMMEPFETIAGLKWFDVDDWPAWARDAIRANIEAGVIRGKIIDGDPTKRVFDPYAPLTRAEAAALLQRIGAV